MPSDLALRQLAFPLRVDADGHSVVVSGPRAVEQLIVELLFTGPGERLNEPTLGCGIVELLFDATTAELVAATQAQVMGSLQRWLGDLVTVLGVSVAAHGSEVAVTVSYRLLGTTQVLSTTVSP